MALSIKKVVLTSVLSYKLTKTKLVTKVGTLDPLITVSQNHDHGAVGLHYLRLIS